MIGNYTLVIDIETFRDYNSTLPDFIKVGSKTLQVRGIDL